jgi:SAM-dependent methyltransferase
MKTEWSTFDYTQVKGIPEVALRVQMLHDQLQELAGETQPDILEVGLGAGDGTLMLAQQFEHLTCIDADPETCTQVLDRLEENRLDHVQFTASTIEDAELEQDAFDHIVLMGILEHLKDPVSVLKALAPSLRSDGRIHITVNLAHSLHRLLGEAMGMISNVEELSDSDIRLGHYRVYTLDELVGHVTEAGLEVLYEQPFYMKPLPTSMLGDVPMEVHQGLNVLGQRYPEFASYVYLEVG